MKVELSNSVLELIQLFCGKDDICLANCKAAWIGSLEKAKDLLLKIDKEYNERTEAINKEKFKKLLEEAYAQLATQMEQTTSKPNTNKISEFIAEHAEKQTPLTKLN